MSDAKTIRDMLIAVRAERKRLEDRIDVLEEREETLVEWLKEEAVQQEDGPLGNGEAARPTTPLAKFLDLALANSKQTTEELAELLKSDPVLSEAHRSPGRAVNLTLQGWKRLGRVGKDGSGRWYKKQGH